MTLLPLDCVRKLCRLGEGEGGRDVDGARGPGLGSTPTPLRDAEGGKEDEAEAEGGGVDSGFFFVSFATPPFGPPTPPAPTPRVKERRKDHSPSNWRESNSEERGAYSRRAVSRMGSRVRSAMRIINTEGVSGQESASIMIGKHDI